MDIFPKRLTHGFGPKLAIFPTALFRQYKPGKCLLRYSRTKKRFVNQKNKKFKKSKNWHFCRGVNPWFRSKNGPFSNFVFLSNKGFENVFYEILERKNAFLGYKNNKLRKSKNWHFSKGVNPWFWSNNGRFSIFFFFEAI